MSRPWVSPDLMQRVLESQQNYGTLRGFSSQMSRREAAIDGPVPISLLSMRKAHKDPDAEIKFIPKDIKGLVAMINHRKVKEDIVIRKNDLTPMSSFPPPPPPMTLELAKQLGLTKSKNPHGVDLARFVQQPEKFRIYPCDLSMWETVEIKDTFDAFIEFMRWGPDISFVRAVIKDSDLMDKYHKLQRFDFSDLTKRSIDFCPQDWIKEFKQKFNERVFEVRFSFLHLEYSSAMLNTLSSVEARLSLGVEGIASSNRFICGFPFVDSEMIVFDERYMDTGDHQDLSMKSFLPNLAGL